MMQLSWPDGEPEEVLSPEDDEVTCEFCLQRLELMSMDAVTQVYACPCGRTWE